MRKLLRSFSCIVELLSLPCSTLKNPAGYCRTLPNFVEHINLELQRTFQTFKEPCDTFWYVMVPCETLWNPMELHGTSWNPAEPQRNSYGTLWSLVGPDGTVWNLVETDRIS